VPTILSRTVPEPMLPEQVRERCIRDMANVRQGREMREKSGDDMNAKMNLLRKHRCGGRSDRGKRIPVGL